MRFMIAAIRGSTRFRVIKNRWNNYNVIDSARTGPMACMGMRLDPLEAVRLAWKFEHG